MTTRKKCLEVPDYSSKEAMKPLIPCDIIPEEGEDFCDDCLDKIMTKFQNTWKEYRNEAGQLHREDGPAVERANGSKEWYIDGKRHREDGPAVEQVGGTKYWYINDKLHREDGPAMEWTDGHKSWWINGRLHREDGLAIEYADGTKEWWVNGIQVTEREVMGNSNDLEEYDNEW